MQLVLGNDELVAAWVAERIPHVDTFLMPVTIGLADDDGLVAAVVYHAYDKLHGNIEMSMAATSPKWATRANIAAFLSYPFRQLECRRVTTLIPKRNKRARKLNKGLGFTLEGVVRQGFWPDDLCVYGLLRHEAARWLGEDHGEKVVRRAGSA